MATPKHAIEGLSPEEWLARIELMRDMATSEGGSIRPAQHDELMRRLEDAERNAHDAMPWEEARGRIRERRR